MIKSRRFSGPSLTPMIDVVFLLLLFFLLSSQIKPEQVMPLDIAAGGSESQTQIQLIELGISTKLNDEETSPENLVAKLLLLDPEETSIAIRSDASISFGQVISLMDELRAKGFSKIVLVEKPNEE